MLISLINKSSENLAEEGFCTTEESEAEIIEKKKRPRAAKTNAYEQQKNFDIHGLIFKGK